MTSTYSSKLFVGASRVLARSSSSRSATASRAPGWSTYARHAAALSNGPPWSSSERFDASESAA